MWSKNIIKIPNIIWKKQHPTEKPVELYNQLLLNSTDEWDIVVDPFAWVWPIISSCKENNRKYIAIDIDQEYYDIAVAK